MKVSLVAHSIFVLVAFCGMYFSNSAEEKGRTNPAIPGVEEGKNPFIKFLDFVIGVGILVLEFHNLPWWGAILHFIIFFFLSPFVVSILASPLNEKQTWLIAIPLKLVMIILLPLEIFGWVNFY